MPASRQTTAVRRRAASARDAQPARGRLGISWSRCPWPIVRSGPAARSRNADGAVAFADLSAARNERELHGEDLERLAVAAYMLGRDGECEQAWLAANRVWSKRGEAERAGAVRSGMRIRRGGVRPDVPRVRADPPGTARRRDGAARRAHGLGHRRRGRTTLAGIAYCQVITCVRRCSMSSREGMDAGAHPLVRFTARHRAGPGQLPRPALRDPPAAGRMATPWIAHTRRASGSPGPRTGIRSDPPTTSWANPASARRARGGRRVLPSRECGRAAPRARDVVAAPGAGARVRLLIGVACRELGDGASAELEFDAARGTPEELGAAPDLERLARLVGSPSPGGLSRREE